MNMQEAIDRAEASPGRKLRAEACAPWLRLKLDPHGGGTIFERFNSVTGKWETAAILTRWVKTETWELEELPLKAWLGLCVSRGEPLEDVFFTRFSDKSPGEGFVRAPWLDQPPPDLKVPPRPELR